MININKIAEQKISGKFYNNKKELLKADYPIEGFLKFDRYYLENSYLRFEQLVPRPQKGNHLYFNTEDGITIKIKFPTVNNTEVVFYIEEIRFPFRGNNILEYHSGIVNNLLYFETDLLFQGTNIERREVPRQKRNSMFDSYYVLKPNSEFKNKDIELYFLLLSTYTGSKFFIREIKNKREHKFINRSPKSRKIRVYGSGKLLYPIEINELENIYQKVNHDFLETVLHLYTSFCTTDGIIDQLIKGASVLDFLIEVYKESNNSINLGRGKTKQLYKVLDNIVSDRKVKKYISYLFEEYPSSYTNVSKKLEFWEKRDQYVHRGNLLFNSNQIFNLHHSVFTINEILRIILINLYKFDPILLSEKKVYKVRNMESSIKYRREFINKVW